MLFYGKDMSQWRNFKKPYLNSRGLVENNEMKLTGEGSENLLTKNKYDYFYLPLEWKISKAGNSGRSLIGLFLSCEDFS